MKDDDDYITAPNWTPILHRDIKPDNVLLRSRSTLGTKKYFYCVLSDFGLACEDDGTDQHQKIRCKLGTKHFFAPELCWDPYPREQPYGRRDEQFNYFPGDHKHTRYSDVWALGACIYNLARPDFPVVHGRMQRGSFTHLDFSFLPPSMDIGQWMEGTRSRKHPLDVGSSYSAYLRAAIQYATGRNPSNRPDAIMLIRQMKGLMREAGLKYQGPQNLAEELPAWATKVHDYHSLTPLRKTI